MSLKASNTKLGQHIVSVHSQSLRGNTFSLPTVFFCITQIVRQLFLPDSFCHLTGIFFRVVRCREQTIPLKCIKFCMGLKCIENVHLGLNIIIIIFLFELLFILFFIEVFGNMFRYFDRTEPRKSLIFAAYDRMKNFPQFIPKVHASKTSLSLKKKKERKDIKIKTAIIPYIIFLSNWIKKIFIISL